MSFFILNIIFLKKLEFFFLFPVMYNLLFFYVVDFFFFFILFFSFFIYILSLLGLILNLKNLLISLLFIELSYFGIITFLVFFSLFFSIYTGFLYAVLLILVAAAESTIGLGILIIVFTFDKNITFDTLIELQG
jgi:NADH-quinone oxidoreductase subunit K